MDIPVVVNESLWLPGPYDNKRHAQPMDEGRVIDNYSVGVQGFQFAQKMKINYIHSCMAIYSQN